MKKIITLAAAVASLFAFDKVIPQEKIINVLKLSPVYKQLAGPIKKGEVKLKGTQKDGFYIIEINTPRGRGLLYITADGKYTVIGRVIDNKTSRPLVPNFPKNVDVVKKGVMFTFGKGNKDIYLITDPECPYCRIMEKEKKDILEKNYRVHVILYPLSFHKHAKDMSYYILAGKTDEERAKRLREVLSGADAWKKFKPTKEQKEKFDKELAAAKKAVEELGARGTPTIFDEKFNTIDWSSIK